MRILPFSLSLVLLTACVAGTTAQTYTIKLKTRADEGMTYSYREVSKESGSTKMFDADGKLVREIKPKERESAYTSTVLEKGKHERHSAKLVRVYEQASETVEGKKKIFPYQGASRFRVERWFVPRRSGWQTSRLRRFARADRQDQQKSQAA